MHGSITNSSFKSSCSELTSWLSEPNAVNNRACDQCRNSVLRVVAFPLQSKTWRYDFSAQQISSLVHLPATLSAKRNDLVPRASREWERYEHSGNEIKSGGKKQLAHWLVQCSPFQRPIKTLVVMDTPYFPTCFCVCCVSFGLWKWRPVPTKKVVTMKVLVETAMLFSIVSGLYLGRRFMKH